MDEVIVFVGARGGQGTSTVAAVAALEAARHVRTSLLCADPLATAALLGTRPLLPGESCEIAPGLTLADLDGPRGAVTVIDAGLAATAAPGPPDARTVVVIRDPCYLALHSVASRTDLRADGVVVVTEASRSLSENDVGEVLALPVLASVPAQPDIALMVDAGVLLSDASGHPGLAPVRTLVEHLVPDLTRERTTSLTARPSPATVAADTPALDVEVGW